MISYIMHNIPRCTHNGTDTGKRWYYVVFRVSLCDYMIPISLQCYHISDGISVGEYFQTHSWPFTMTLTIKIQNKELCNETCEYKTLKYNK